MKYVIKERDSNYHVKKLNPILLCDSAKEAMKFDYKEAAIIMFLYGLGFNFLIAKYYGEKIL